MRHPTLRLAALLAALLLAGSVDRGAVAADPPKDAVAPTLDAAQIAAVDAAVEAEITKQEIVGVAVGVVRDGRVVFAKGYGLADRELRTPVTAKTVFNWASNSKPLVAVLAMQLVEKGLLDLDADVRKYVPEWPEKDAPVTCREILCHQSGIPHYGPDIAGTPKSHKQELPYLDPIVSLERFDRSKLLFAPGTKTHYSTFAFILLSAAVQRAGKAPLMDQVRDRIAKPLGLSSLELDVPTKAQPEWATGYVKSDTKIVAAREEAHYWKHGGGAYKSNVTDFAGWAAGLMDRKLFGEAAETAMWKPQPTADGKSTDWGLGISVGGRGDDPFLSHTGKQPEATSAMQLQPRRKEGVVVLCNCDYGSPSAIATAVTKALNGR